MSLKAELLELYRKEHEAFKAVKRAHPGEDMAGPLLMSPNERYYRQANRLLIVGQETRGWHYHIDDLELQMAKYEEFNLGEHWFPSPFWNVTRQIEAALGIEPFACAWTNLSKFDHNNGRASGSFADSISAVDRIILEELKIVQPTVCLFYTGPAFDTRLCNIFTGVRYSSISGFSTRQVARLEHPALPTFALRTYHPNFLRRSGMEQAFIALVKQLIAGRS
jgi:hypothetical protein